MYSLTKSKNNSFNAPLIDSLVVIFSLFVFGCVSTYGFSAQYNFGILFHFSFLNLIIFALSIMYIITISQYFLLCDNAFGYYSFYLLSNIVYWHCNVSMDLDVNTLTPDMEVLVKYITILKSIVLIGSYYLYVHFTINFLSIPEKHPALHKRLLFYSRLFLVLMLLTTLLVPFSLYSEHWNTVRMIFVAACIPLGLVCIVDCVRYIKGKLAAIFLLGSFFYYLGSVLGFLFSSRFLENPFTNPVMSEWGFFTQTGTLLEVIFFSSGLAYRMRLIEVQKHAIEQELLKEKLKELEMQNALIKQRERISHDLHDDVGGTLNSISVFSEIAKRQINSIHPEATPMLERIGEASRDLITTINDIVWAMNPKNDQFENIALRMQLFAADLLVSKDVLIQFQADAKLNTLNLDVERRKHFYLIFKEAVNNVFKYAECSTLETHIHLKENNICMTIVDNGKGFNLRQSKNGNGLISMTERAKLLRGSIDIESQLNKGTTLKLCFPINENDSEKLPESVVETTEKTSKFVFSLNNMLNFRTSKVEPIP